MGAVMALHVVHRTDYVYDSVVSSSYGQVYMLPRSSPGQEVLRCKVSIEPTPDSYSEFTDYFGNRVANFSVATDHTELVITTTTDVDVSRRSVPTSAHLPSLSWEEAATVLAQSNAPEHVEAREFSFPSPLVPATDPVRHYAAASFTPGRNVFELITELTNRIHSDVRYKAGVTSLATLPDDVLRLREGVCQDYAHLQIACLRSFGIAARYVSGYLETVAPPGKTKLRGADASHAWLSVYIPGYGWVDVDPTNDCFVADRHVSTAWGRDYQDVSPIKGVIFTDAKSNIMTVSVDVSHLD
jgi:transglutaminase-like putative cysteine protease